MTIMDKADAEAAHAAWYEREMMTKMNKSAAEDAYTAKWQQAQNMIDQIKASLDAMPAPSDKTTWGQVGDLGHICQQLREILGEEE